MDKKVGSFFLVQFLFSFGTGKLEFWTQSKRSRYKVPKSTFLRVVSDFVLL